MGQRKTPRSGCCPSPRASQELHDARRAPPLAKRSPRWSGPNRRGAATRVTSWPADRPALHPWSQVHPEAGADSLGMRGKRGPGARSPCASTSRLGRGFAPAADDQLKRHSAVPVASMHRHDVSACELDIGGNPSTVAVATRHEERRAHPRCGRSCQAVAAVRRSMRVTQRVPAAAAGLHAGGARAHARPSVRRASVALLLVVGSEHVVVGGAGGYRSGGRSWCSVLVSRRRRHSGRVLSRPAAGPEQVARRARRLSLRGRDDLDQGVHALPGDGP